MKHGHYLPVKVIREYAGKETVDVQLADGQFVQTSIKNVIYHVPALEADQDTVTESSKPKAKMLTQPTRIQKKVESAAKPDKLVHPFTLPSPNVEPPAVPPKVTRVVKKANK